MIAKFHLTSNTRLLIFSGRTFWPKGLCQLLTASLSALMQLRISVYSIMHTHLYVRTSAHTLQKCGHTQVYTHVILYSAPSPLQHCNCANICSVNALKEDQSPVHCRLHKGSHPPPGVPIGVRHSMLQQVTGCHVLRGGRRRRRKGGVDKGVGSGKGCRRRWRKD